MAPVTTKLFLVDGVGALVTATLLLAVLARFESTFGMPVRIIYLLAALACVFAAYSLTCHFTLRGDWRPFLKAIAAANIAYCLITLALLILFRNEITVFGVIYFVGEIFMVAALAAYEWSVARAGRVSADPTSL